MAEDKHGKIVVVPRTPRDDVLMAVGGEGDGAFGHLLAAVAVGRMDATTEY